MSTVHDLNQCPSRYEQNISRLAKSPLFPPEVTRDLETLGFSDRDCDGGMDGSPCADCIKDIIFTGKVGLFLPVKKGLYSGFL